MSSNRVISSAGRALTPGAVALMLMLCVSWGFNQIAVKLALPDVPPMMQALIRSAGALPVMLLVGWLRGVKFFERDGTLGPGLLAGLLFGIEFVLIFSGLVFTSASRAAVFLYTAPFFVALGSYQFLGERLTALQWSGLALSFAGVALAIGVPQPNVDARVLLGDLLVVGGGALWAATTLIAKGTRLRNAAPEKALSYQVAVSIPILACLSGHLGGRMHLRAVVRAGKNLFGEQTIGLHLHHPVVRRRRRLFHHARSAHASLRRRSAVGDRGALSRQQAGSQGHAGSERAGVTARIRS
jgi:drug/metabolite transporter (DMT)-like permease